MYSEADLDSAVDARVLDVRTADAFRAHVASLRSAPAVDEEQFRLITGFNDVFVSIAILLVVVPLAVGGSTRAFGSLVVAAIAWGLAEFFTRRRRMALPSIVLLLAFVGGVFNALRIILGDGSGAAGRLPPEVVVTVAALLAAAAAWLHWRRFMVPITVAAGTAGLVGAAYAALRFALPDDRMIQLAPVALLGVAVFVLAMWWDASDRSRQTRRSDVAFWLHLLAAPMIAHPIFAMIGVFDGSLDLDPGKTVAIFALYAFFAVVSLAVDRRALLVSGLAYFIYAVTAVLGRNGDAFIPTAIIVGASLLLLSALWAQVRSAIVVYLPEEIRLRLPPIQRDLIPRPAS